MNGTCLAGDTFTGGEEQSHRALEQACCSGEERHTVCLLSERIMPLNKQHVVLCS